MKRVLHIVSSMNCGGIETFIMNIYRNIDKNKIQFDFIVNIDEEGFYDSEIKELGGKIYSVCPKKENIFKNFFQVKKIIKKNQYSIVHRHGSNSMMATDLLAAKCVGVKCRIAHSHNIKASGSQFAHKIFKWILPFVTTDRFACSDAAGKHLFQNKVFTIINNAVDANKFKYNKLIRNKVRSELNIKEDNFVVGNVARFHPQKNHEFLIDIFHELYSKNDKAILLLVGNGELQNNIQNKVKKLGMEKCVIFLDVRKDIHNIMQAMDLFLFPSIYEGLGIVLIEAQCAGLPCVTSDRVVPTQVKITELVKFISLEKTANEWAEEICQFNKQLDDRKNTKKEIIEAGYDINTYVLELEEFYYEH